MGMKKRKKGRQKSKAAQATADMKAAREEEEVAERGISGEYKGGVMSSMRGGFQSAVGQSEDKGKGSVLNTLLWIAVVAAAVFFFMGQFR